MLPDLSAWAYPAGTELLVLVDPPLPKKTMMNEAIKFKMSPRTGIEMIVPQMPLRVSPRLSGIGKMM